MLDATHRLEKKLTELIDSSGGHAACWPWRGKLSEGEYPHIQHLGVALAVDLLMYVAEYGPLPAGKIICHHCDNPPCCNPAHLFAGTSRENTQDMIAKGRDRFFGRKTITKHEREEDQALWAEFCAPDRHDFTGKAV